MKASKVLFVAEPQVSIVDGKFTLSAELSGVCSGKCFFSLPQEYSDWVDPASSDCFAVGLLYTAMFDGADMELAGDISEKLLFTINTYVIPMLNGFDPRLQQIKVRAKTISPRNYPEAIHGGCGFSGGIDSFYTIYRHGIQNNTPERFKIDTLFFFNVGAHGMGNSPERLKWLEDKFKKRFELLSAYAKDVNMPYIPVNSNLHSFHQSGHLQTDSLASASAALFVSRKLACYYLGSLGHDYYTQIRCADTQNSEIALINDLLLPQLCTEKLSFFADGGAFSRSGKTEQISDYQIVKKYLNVCGNPETVDKNCSVCFKCKRTMLTLDIMGKLQEFSALFDLKKFDDNAKKNYIAEVLNHHDKDLFCLDIYNYALKKGIRLEDRTTLFCRIYMRFATSKTANNLRKIKNNLFKKSSAR